MFHIPSQPHKRRRYTTKPSQRRDSSTHDGHDEDDDEHHFNDPREAFGNQSLPVAELPLDFDGIPLDGEQYLATVRVEAASHPNIFYATHNPYATADTEGQSHEEVAGQGKAHLLRTLSMPSEDWRAAFLVKFCNMREALSNAPMDKVPYIQDRLPRPSNADGWYAWIHGKPPSAKDAVKGASAASPLWAAGKTPMEDDDMDMDQSSDEAETGTSPSRSGIKEPSGGALRRLHTDHVLGILEAFPYWLAPGIHLTTPYDDLRAAHPSLTDAHLRQTSPVIHPLHSRWLFALLAWLDARLVSDQISVLRTLVRACIAAIKIGRIRNKALESRRKKVMATDLPVDGTGSVVVDGSADKQSGAEGERAEVTSASAVSAKPTKAGSAVAAENSGKVNSGEIGAWMAVTAIAGIWGQTDLWDDAVADLKGTV